MGIKRHLTSVLLLLYCLLTASTASSEPLRLLVPEFFGPKPLSQHVRTTIFFEITKAFRAVDAPDKGVWILYGQDELQQPSHDAVLSAAKWPSVSADLVVWGQVHQYDDGVVVQPYLTLTSLIKKRLVRPELWTLTLKDGTGETIRLELDIPGQFYQFEPLLLTAEAIIAFENPQGVPLYSARQEGTIIGSIGKGVIWFDEIHDDALLVATNGLKGWVRIWPITQQRSEAIDFSKGMVRLLRGDWRGAQHSFAAVLENSDLPQNLRIHALIYSGLAKEKSGLSGRSEFTAAYALNRLDKAVAAYLLMSQAAEIARLQGAEAQEQLPKAQDNLRTTLSATKNLFAEDDPLLSKMRLLLRRHN